VSNFTDDFSDGVADGWNTQVGSWSVVDGEYSVSVGGNGISTMTGLNLTDCTIETKFRFTDNVGFRAGLVFRYMKNDTYYALEVSNEYDVLCFVKYLPQYASYGTQDHGFVGTAPTEVDFATGELMLGRKIIGSVPIATIDKDVEYILRVTLSGNTFFGELMNDGFYQRIVWEDTDSPFEYGTVGLRARRADVSFDYLTVSNQILIPKPTLDLSCKSTDYYSGFNVEIEGNLAFNGTAISYAPILLSYSVTGGKSWEDLTLVNTDSDGHYSATWMPSVTGNYLIKATYDGDKDYIGTSTTVNLAVTKSVENVLFSVTSNSTLTSLIFNSQTRELSFTVTGPQGTTGYVDLNVPNSLIANIATVKAYIDGNEIAYTFDSVNDSWLLHFSYPHSTHEVVLNLGLPKSKPLFDNNIRNVIIICSFLAVCVASIVYFKKRKR
jgi:hypothetical protein